ncbi:MAG: DUF11 domain-containing protein, partial [Anaerolineae bacterium]|nr:DUF11 domain-containing protein [Anaerolineae bacterium]
MENTMSFKIYRLIKIQQWGVALSLALLMAFTAVEIGLADGPGSLDPSFGIDGQVFTDFGDSPEYITGLALQPDGKIVAVGENSVNNYDFAVARYNSDGSLDSSFGGDGKVTTDFGRVDIGTDVAIQPDGKIVVAGYVWAGVTNGSFVLLARYNSDGTLDPSFDGDGKVMTNYGADDVARMLAIQPDGKIVIAGNTNGHAMLGRYNADGSLDTSFGTAGKVIVDKAGTSDTFGSVIVLPDGKLLIGASTYSGGATDCVLTRYNNDGSLDTSFGAGGKVITDINYRDGCGAMTLQADGKVIRTGATSGEDFISDISLMRYNDDGSLDPSFGTDGIVTTDFGSPNEGASGITIQANGQILVAGYVTNGMTDFALARYNSDGSLDLSFGKAGKVITNLGGFDRGLAIELQPDNKIIVGGYKTISGNGDGALVRYLGGVGPRLSLTKTLQAVSYPIQPGDPITYTIVVANDGDTDASGVLITDPLPPFIEGGDLSQTVAVTAGRRMTFTLNVAVAANAPLAAVITNTATLSHTSGIVEYRAVFTVGLTPPEEQASTIFLPLILKN